MAASIFGFYNLRSSGWPQASSKFSEHPNEGEQYGKRVDIPHGWVESLIVDNNEWCKEGITETIPMHYLQEADELVSIEQGSARVKVGDNRYAEKTKIKHDVIVEPGDIIERVKGTPWTIEPLVRSADTPLTLSAYLSPKFDPSKVVQVEVIE